MNIVIGIDPDSKAHGVAKYVDGKLTELKNQQLCELIHEHILLFKTMHGGEENTNVKFAIEDVCANKFIYTRNVKTNTRVQSKVAISVGACQQSQVELMRMLDYFEVPYSLHKPTSSNWAKNKARFESLTHWSGRSNEDTRSAAYFGFVGSRK